VPYLSALEVCSGRGAIQIHVYLYFPGQFKTTEHLPMTIAKTCLSVSLQPTYFSAVISSQIGSINLSLLEIAGQDFNIKLDALQVTIKALLYIIQNIL